MSSTFKLIYHKRSLKFLEKQEMAVQQRIAKALTGLTVRPPIGDIKPLQGRGSLMRLRVGTYRVVFEVNISEETVYIWTIDNRGDVY
ncbi:type II toxin-antitoxin system RelE family toxin [Paenibacillus crassostreae]|uniref:Plasmid stabilization protein n=1 Tax=Paenibacillus crassostreae TaxID=1763538 RepID=A0A167EJS5_9BACL|nr:type II toxin-antitoxin system RelE/ParE family toxin [Paenibacillus crassostreae]AOZ94930.1 plasmid stabilization protein [Paenibacillus crassostreae]OAB75612.1 plasmid stabilization protein [Paenibacillus crassostreae]